MDSKTNDYPVDFTGVQEIVSATRNAARIATWTTAIIGVYLVFFSFLILLNYFPHKSPSLIVQFVFVGMGISIALWLTTFSLHNSKYFGTITLNSDIAYRSASDFFSSGFGGSVFSQIERAAGHLRVSRFGISGIVSIPWNRIVQIKYEGNSSVQIHTRSFSVCGASAKMVLRFQTKEDCKTFMSLSLAHHHPMTP